jgi:transcriptional regulator with XRE-family HTH domain
MPKLQSAVCKAILAQMNRAKPPVTLGKLAIETEIDKGYLSKIFHGKKRLHIEHIAAISKALKVHPGKLFEKF